MPTTFAVLGDGAWGTAVAVLLAARPEHRVRLWSPRAENGQLLRHHRENVRFLPGVPIPPAVQLTGEVGEAVVDADLWIAAVPTVYLRSTLSAVASSLRASIPVLSLAKGIEVETFRRPTEIVLEVLGERPVVVLSGPSHAEEVSRGLPTSVVVASAEPDLARDVQRHFGGDRFRVYTSADVLGVELAGAVKNVFGIAAGVCDGLGFGDNSKAALMTRSLVEMTRFGVALGAEHQTFHGLAGMGDLITTCISPHGRNRAVGERLGRGETREQIVGSMSMVAEGVWTTRSVYECATRMGVEMPIATEVYRVLYEGKSPQASLTELMLRRPRTETLL
jgi:glycerol-3-phosphate dehydrogenase (NAD(P)+)